MTGQGGEIARGYSTSTTGLTESKLHEKHLCDYVANVAKGCPHGCEFCYNKAAPQYVFDPGNEIEDHDRDGSDYWGDYALYRDHLPAAVAKDLESGLEKWTEQGRGVVGLCFGTDPYFDPTAGKITGITLRILRDHGQPARILTRNPALAWQMHRQLFVEMAQEGLLTVGASIPHLEEDEVAAIEPRAQPVHRRLEYLKNLSAAGIPVYVSMSPTFPTIQSAAEMRELLEAIAEVDPTVVFHEPINPRKGNIGDCIDAAAAADESSLQAQLMRVDESRDVWAQYACAHLAWAQQQGRDLDLPMHLWPDEQLVDVVPEEAGQWLAAWRDRQSPEAFPDRPAPNSPPPEPPSTFTWGQRLEIGDFA